MPSTRRLATWSNSRRVQRSPLYAVPVFVLSVPLQTVQRYRCRRPALVANEPYPTMLRPGFPRLSHPEVAHAIPSVGFMAQVYRRVRLLVSPTIVGVQLTDQQRTAQAPGNARICKLPEGVLVASVVAQKGYGESVGPRIRYTALRKGLETVAEAAAQEGATVHMPRIGTGQGGGSWSVIEDILQATFGEKSVSVTVYDLPGAPLPPRLPLQKELAVT